MPRYVTFEHERAGYEPEVMSEREFQEGGSSIVEEAGAFVWHEADTREQALAQHNHKQDEWLADVMAGRDEKQTY